MAGEERSRVTAYCLPIRFSVAGKSAYRKLTHRQPPESFAEFFMLLTRNWRLMGIFSFRTNS